MTTTTNSCRLLSVALSTTAALAMSSRVAVVTGANKGVGFHIAEQLIASRNFGTVILACRDPGRGRAAAEQLGGTFMPLDISEPASVEAFAGAVRAEHGRLDTLVNNAAIAFKGSDPTPFAEQTGPTLRANFYGTCAVTEALLPLLREGASPRVVMVASMAGQLAQVAPPWQERFADERATLASVKECVGAFARAVAAGTHRQDGWGNSNYGLSKLAVIAATRVFARENPGVLVNACCPGYCDTDMSSHRGPRPPAEGAANAVMLVDLPDGGPSGGFYQNLAPSKW